MKYSVFKSFCQVLFVLLPIACASEDSWNYDNPELWYRQYPQCRGRRQSPIDITQPLIVKLPSINFGSYDKSFNKTSSIENDGHTIQFNIPSTIKGQPYITGGPLKRKYEAVEIHFHWAPEGGSDHTIDGKLSDLEMHIVHQSDIGDLTVLVILLDVAKPPTPLLDEISDKLKDVIQYKSKAKIENFTKLNSILGNLNTESYYTYLGSLTTPPCTENVIWIIFSDHLGVDENMISNFMQVKDSRGYNQTSTIRPVQAQNKRKIYYSKSN